MTAPRFIIRDETVHAAFDLLEQAVESASAARAMRERTEDLRRAAKAQEFLDATGTVAERDAKATASESYREACERYYEAVREDEKWRAATSKATAIIEAWRSVQANYRAMGKVA